MARRDPHRRNGYDRRRDLIVAAANADPTTRCYRCGLPLHQHPPHRNGKPQTWTADHIREQDPTSPLAPAASRCNYAAGARYVNRRRAPERRSDW